ncbi:MAG: hypothetical protein U0798_15070 [Gemmataceae bacterium]
MQTWNGVVKVDPDGLVQQVSFSIGPGGIHTMASTNSEFSTVLPSYSARRMRENLAANPLAALANIKDAQIHNRREGSTAAGGGIIAAAFAAGALGGDT